MASISVVIPVFNNVHFTRRCLASVVDGSSTAHEIIVVDNHSTDETPGFLKEFKSNAEKKGWSFQIITNSENRGVSAAFNAGIKASKADYVALLNNDTWIMPRWDQALLECARRLGGAMVAPHYHEEPFDPIRTPQLAEKFIRRNKGKQSRDWAAIMMFFQRRVFEEIGYFDERFFLTYEDRDFRERLDRAGLKYYKVGDCFIWHHSKGTRDSGQIKSGYEQESLAKFIAKWGFDPQPLENTRQVKLRRKWTRFKNKFGYF